MRCLGLAAVSFYGCPPHAMTAECVLLLSSGRLSPFLLPCSLRPADPSASAKTDASETKLVPLSNESIACSSQHIASYCRPFSTFASQLSCPRSTARLHHYSKTPKAHASAPWLRWQQACPLVQRQRPRILRKWRHGPIDDARRAPGVDPSRCSSISMMIPETRPTQRVHTKRRRARGRGRRQGRGHGHRRPGQEGH